MGHSIGESSMGWSSSENTTESLVKVSRTPSIFLFNVLPEVTQKCQEFVKNGNYLIILQDGKPAWDEKRAY